MKLQDIICASFANLIHDYKVELSEFRDGKLTINSVEDNFEFYNKLMEVVYDDVLDIQVDKVSKNTLILH